MFCSAGILWEFIGTKGIQQAKTMKYVGVGLDAEHQKIVFHIYKIILQIGKFKNKYKELCMLKVTYEIMRVQLVQVIYDDFK